MVTSLQIRQLESRHDEDTPPWEARKRCQARPQRLMETEVEVEPSPSRNPGDCSASSIGICVGCGVGEERRTRWNERE